MSWRHVRPAEPEDLPYVLQTWWGLEGKGRCTPAEHNRRAYEALGRDDVTVLVAHDPEDRNAIWGFSVSEGPAVLVLYVRRFVRGTKGIEEALRPQPKENAT